MKLLEQMQRIRAEFRLRRKTCFNCEQISRDALGRAIVVHLENFEQLQQRCRRASVTIESWIGIASTRVM